MKSMIKMALYPLSGVIVFVVALAIILATRGKLNAEGLQRLPGIGGDVDNQDNNAAELPTVATMRYLSSEELSEMLKEAMALKQKAEAERARLADRETRIQAYVKDLALEKQGILKMRAEVDAKRRELKKAEGELTDRINEVSSVELAGLRRSAAIHAAMDSKKAAAAIATLDGKHAAKLFSFMEEKKAARILQEMTPEAAAELLSLLKQVKANTDGKKR